LDKQGHFDPGEGQQLIMQSWGFDDKVDTNNFIEVTISFNDGSKRWCNLTTPEKLTEHFKNSVIDPPGMSSRHLIIMKTLKYEEVEKTLKYLDSQGELEDATLPLLNVIL
jgi:hypothetical protein